MTERHVLELMGMMAYGVALGAACAWLGLSFSWTMFLLGFTLIGVSGRVRSWARVVTTPEPRPTHDDI